MGKHRPIKIGDEFVSSDGEQLTVTQYVDAKNIEVMDSVGNKRATDSTALLTCNIKWRTKDGSVAKPRRTLCPAVKKTARQKMLDKLYVGSVWQSNRFGAFEIVEVITSLFVVIKWHSTGKLQTTSASAIYTGCVVNAEPPSFGVEPEGHYVYITTVRGEIVYVGRGQRDRYKHTISGRSGNRELNRLYFSDEPMVTEIFRQGLTREEAKKLEKLMIDRHKPRCNSVVYTVDLSG